MDAAMGRLKKICGSEFFDAVASGAIKLRVHEIVEYAEKDAKVMQRLKPLLEEGVGLRKALSVNEGVITSESRFELANLMVKANGGKPLNIVVEGVRWKGEVVKENS